MSRLGLPGLVGHATALAIDGDEAPEDGVAPRFDPRGGIAADFAEQRQVELRFRHQARAFAGAVLKIDHRGDEKRVVLFLRVNVDVCRWDEHGLVGAGRDQGFVGKFDDEAEILIGVLLPGGLGSSRCDNDRCGC